MPAKRSGPKSWFIPLLMAVIFVLPLALRRSSAAWILGRYSLPYFLGMIVVGLAGLAIGAVLVKPRKRLPIALVACTGMILGGIVTELGGQIYASLNPAFDVLHLQPDATVGWRIVPKLEFIWAGHYWYARDFSIPIRINSIGFNDKEHAEAKPSGTTRVALIGDSMVEALQVPFNKTAAQLLESELNAVPANDKGTAASRYEVLNFGVSNYSLGQYFLNWESTVRAFKPDYVFAFVASFHMTRTVSAFEEGAFPGPEQDRLSVRPTFSLDGGHLKANPPRDYAKFLSAQNQIIETQFNGQRSRRKARRCFLTSRCLFGVYDSLMFYQSSFQPAGERYGMNDEILQINLSIIEKFGASVAAAGGKLVIVDACTYFDPASGDTAEAMKRVCQEKSIGYLLLSGDLIAENKAGRTTRWGNDVHFNELGNRVFTEAMLQWLRENAMPAGSSVARH